MCSGEAREQRRWTPGIPEGVREVIGRRLDHLSARCNQAVTVAAVVGKSFTGKLLSMLIYDISEDRIIDVLEEALAARVLEEQPDAVGHYLFTHSLVQQTLLEELTITKRVRLHARIAEALEELHGNEAGKHAAELAGHFGQAEAVLGTEKLVHYSLLAGEQALSIHAYEEGYGALSAGCGGCGEQTHGLRVCRPRIRSGSRPRPSGQIAGSDSSSPECI